MDRRADSRGHVFRFTFVCRHSVNITVITLNEIGRPIQDTASKSERLALTASLDKATDARKVIPWFVLLLGISSAAKITGVLGTTLPLWFGPVSITVMLLYYYLLHKRVSKIKQRLLELGPPDDKQVERDFELSKIEKRIRLLAKLSKTGGNDKRAIELFASTNSTQLEYRNKTRYLIDKYIESSDGKVDSSVASLFAQFEDISESISDIT